MAKVEEDHQDFPNNVRVTLWKVGGTVRDPWYTIEATQRGTRREQEAGIRGIDRARQRYARFLRRAGNGEFNNT